MSGKKLALLILGSIGGLLLLVGVGLLLLGRSQAQETEQLVVLGIMGVVAWVGREKVTQPDEVIES